MKNAVSLLLLLLSVASARAGVIEIHTALSSPGTFSDLLAASTKVNEAKAKLIAAAQAQGLNVVERRSSTEADLIQALNRPETVGVIWVGHAKPAYTSVGNKKNFYNYFLLDAQGKYISKALARAPGGALKFLGVATCFLEGIRKKYGLDATPYPVLLSGQSPARANVEASEIDQLSSMLEATIQVFTQARAQLPTLQRSLLPGTSETVTVKIRYLDLLSQNFGHDVFLNDQLVGVLSKEKLSSTTGNESTFSVSKSLLKKDNTLVIRPTDPKRASPEYAHPIDNVVLTGVEVSGVQLLSHAVNLGDDDWVDDETGLRKDIYLGELVAAERRGELQLNFKGRP